MCQRETYNVYRLRVVRQEVQDSPALLDVGLGVGPQSVNQVNKLNAIPDEKYLHGMPWLFVAQENVPSAEHNPLSYLIPVEDIQCACHR